MKNNVNISFDGAAQQAPFWQKTYTTWERTSFRVFERFATDAVVLDIGGWVGVTSLWFAKVRLY